MGETARQATKIMLIRHAEKPTEDSHDVGVNPQGERESESLTVRGWQRAGALAALLAPASGSFQDPALARPQFIYASTPSKRQGSRRAVETMTPLAEKLAIRINSNYPKLDWERMLEEAFLCAGVILICWQHDFLPKIAGRILGNRAAVPQEWPEDRYDMIWVFDRDAASAGTYSFKQVPQNLLMGDWAIPIR